MPAIVMEPQDALIFGLSILVIGIILGWGACVFFTTTPKVTPIANAPIPMNEDDFDQRQRPRISEERPLEVRQIKQS